MEVWAICVLASLLRVVDGECSRTSWEQSFDYTSLSKCNERNYYIRGLERSAVPSSIWKSDGLHLLEGVQCCNPLPQWSKSDVHTVHTHWSDVLGQRDVWAKCPDGYFLQGLYRSDSGWPLYRGYLFHIEEGRCSKPAEHPQAYGGCYEEDIDECFDGEGLCSCRQEGYYVAGIYKGRGSDLHYLEKLYCCKMSEKPYELDSISNVKKRIMDRTLKPMAYLAHMLGFGWCGGCRAPYVGEDFNRFQSKWVAARNGRCQGRRHHQRLSMHFGNWRFEVSEIKYGEEIMEELAPETIDHGLSINNRSLPANETVSVRQYVEETITHIPANTWRGDLESSIELNFQIPDTSGTMMSLTTNYQNSNFTEPNQNQSVRSKVLEASFLKVLPPNSYCEWALSLKRTRRIIPYTAVIVAKFSTEFRGFLRKGQGYNSTSTNYHEDYRGGTTRPNFNYRFGDEYAPFYTALKNESNNNSSPWFWSDMIRSHPYGSSIINRLVDESQYAVFLSGTVETVEVSEVNIKWEEARNITESIDASLLISEPLADDLNSNATTGPSRERANVKYPAVSVNMTGWYDFSSLTIEHNTD